METIDGKDDPLHYGAASPDVFGRTIHCAREAAASITAALAAVPPPAAAARAVAFFVISDNEAVKSRTLALLPNSRALGCAGVPFWKAHDRADMECILSDWCEAVATYDDMLQRSTTRCDVERMECILHRLVRCAGCTAPTGQLRHVPMRWECVDPNGPLRVSRRCCS
jgi:hypothetical protein